jgi:hypothetical protein
VGNGSHESVNEVQGLLKYCIHEVILFPESTHEIGPKWPIDLAWEVENATSN